MDPLSVTSGALQLIEVAHKIIWRIRVRSILRKAESDSVSSLVQESYRLAKELAALVSNVDQTEREESPVVDSATRCAEAAELVVQTTGRLTREDETSEEQRAASCTGLKRVLRSARRRAVLKELRQRTEILDREVVQLRWCSSLNPVPAGEALYSQDPCLPSTDKQTVFWSSPMVSTVGNEAWDSKQVLCLESSDIQFMGCLHVLQHLMTHIAEREWTTQPPVESSAASPLYLLRHSERHMTAGGPKQPDPKDYRFRPCHYFDVICGTGIGGMAAVMLGVMRFSVAEVIEKMGKILDTTSKNYESLQMRLQQYLETGRTRSKGAHLGFLASQQPTLRARAEMCQTICVTALQAKKGIEYPYLLRSYNLPPKDLAKFRRSNTTLRNPCQQTWDMPIVDACLASVAVPHYRSSVTLTGFHGKFKDASTLGVNTAWEAYQEMASLHGGPPPIRYLISISVNAKPAKAYDSCSGRGYDKLEKALQGKFCRFDVPEADTHVCSEATEAGYDKEKTFDQRISENAQASCKENEDALKNCAKILVTARRNRARTPEWSRFAGLNVP